MGSVHWKDAVKAEWLSRRGRPFEVPINSPRTKRITEMLGSPKQDLRGRIAAMFESGELTTTDIPDLVDYQIGVSTLDSLTAEEMDRLQRGYPPRMVDVFRAPNGFKYWTGENTAEAREPVVYPKWDPSTPWIHFDLFMKPELLRGFSTIEASLRQREDVLLHDAASAPVRACGLAYWHAGQQTFVLERDFIDVLGQTEVSKIPLQFLRFPYDGFFVSLREPLQTSGSPVGGFYLSDAEDAFLFVAVRLDGSSFGGKLAFAEHQFSDSGVPFINLEGVINAESATDSTMEERAVMQTALRVGLNLVQYLNTRNPVVEVHRPEVLDHGRVTSPKKLAKLNRKQQRISGATITWVAPHYKKRFAEDAQPAADVGKNWRSIRGHFHHHWVGSRTGPDGTARPGERLELVWHEPVFNAAYRAEAARVYKLA